MGVMKIEKYEKEVVRPYTPTPQSLRNYKLSLLDQLSGTFYTPFIFFYDSPVGDSRPHDYEELKKSLSKTLSILYPLAGRIRDGITVECNDEGAEFVVAEVRGCDLGDILRHPKSELLQELLPRDAYPTAFDPAQPMLAVQVNRFRCGGMALAICIWHGIADAAAILGFLQTWAAINRGVGEGVENNDRFIVDTTSIFPPANFNISKSLISPHVVQKKFESCMKRFVFRAEQIEKLRNEYNQSSSCSDGGRYYTRVEALSAFIWTAVTRANLKACPNIKMQLLTIVMDLRKKMNPPLPSTCLGNINQVTAVQWEANGVSGTQAGSLIGQIREAIKKVTGDYVKKLHANGGYLKACAATLNQADSDVSDIKVVSISSLCKLPFLKVDFGWGRPVWMGPAHMLDSMAIFMDTIDGGVEVLIGLSPLVIRNLDKDHEFLAYVSLSQTIWEPHHLSARL